MTVIVKRFQDSGVSYSELVELLHDSFKERLEQGLAFTCSSMTVEDYIEKTDGKQVFVALDCENQNLVGTVTLQFCKDPNGIIYGYHEYLAVSPKAKNNGVGSAMLNSIEEFVKAVRGEYILSDTAVGATSSVKWHLKNGFRIVRLKSYESTDYYSYGFRKQLVPSIFWDNALFCKIVFIKSSIATKMKLKKNGESTFVGKMLKFRNAL